MQFSLTVIFTTLLAIGVNAQLEATASTLATAILPAAALTQIVVATNVVASEITAVGYKVPVPNVRQDNSGEETSELTVVTYKARVPKVRQDKRGGGWEGYSCVSLRKRNRFICLRFTIVTLVCPVLPFSTSTPRAPAQPPLPPPLP
ncbi:hypothetical protein Vi05172_g13500 [Venturia inaequalis]|nr:hypothetical protein Vi05172_g13500 [Venturia inaequalis]